MTTIQYIYAGVWVVLLLIVRAVNPKVAYGLLAITLLVILYYVVKKYGAAGKVNI